MSDKSSQRKRHILRDLALEVRAFSKDEKRWILGELANVADLTRNQEKLSFTQDQDRIFLQNRLPYVLYKLIRRKSFTEPSSPQDRRLLDMMNECVRAYLKASPSEKEEFQKLAQAKPTLICRNAGRFRNILSNRDRVIN